MPDPQETTATHETEPTASAATRIADLLAEEGYRPRVAEPDGPFRRIDFKAEGTWYVVRVSEEDPDFVGICLGYLFDHPVPDMDVVLRAGVEVQAMAKVVKFCVDPKHAWYEFQAELFLGGGALTARHVERCLHVLRRAAREFADRMRTACPQAQA